ncbi:MAG TPA: hypothetical protein VIM11_07380 [Tepidisphaeraceae bacterium]|jgi:hypothetical protein
MSHDITTTRAAELVIANQMSAHDWVRSVDCFDQIRSECSTEVLAVTDQVRGKAIEPADLAALFSEGGSK